MEKKKKENIDSEQNCSDSRSADTVFQDIMKSATPSDIYGEYCWFKKNLPKNLLKCDREELLKEVKGHMRIGEIKKALVETSYDEDEDITIFAKLGSVCKTSWLPRFKIVCFVQNLSPETTNLRWQLSTPFQVVGHLRLNFKMHLFQDLKLPQNIRQNAATAEEFSISGISLKAMIEFYTR